MFVVEVPLKGLVVRVKVYLVHERLMIVLLIYRYRAGMFGG